MQIQLFNSHRVPSYKSQENGKPMKKITFLFLSIIGVFSGTASATQPDPRQLVDLPPMMSQHMLSNMRDHLVAINTIQQALAESDYDTAADVSENRLGMSSLGSHGAAHMAPFMPDAMQAIGTAMHRNASRFAVVARETAVDGNMHRALDALAKVTSQCIACHNAYRTR